MKLFRVILAVAFTWLAGSIYETASAQWHYDVRIKLKGVVFVGFGPQGEITWNGNPVPSYPTFEAQLAKAARRQPPPVIRLTQSKLATYAQVSRVMASVQHYRLKMTPGLVGTMQAEP